jgi:hypothetical protein
MSPTKFVNTNENIALVTIGCIMLALSGGLVFGGFNLISENSLNPYKSSLYNPDVSEAENCKAALTSWGRPCWDSNKNMCWIVKNDPDVDDCTTLVPKGAWITMWVFAGIIGLIGLILLIVGLVKGTKSPTKKNDSPLPKNKTD